ncbi:MAG: hypothetical protein F6K31_12625 [Symploca sp. SIO2G7]|nr:hypothetical protein [Symploca sp. SIO2G7]
MKSQLLAKLFTAGTIAVTGVTVTSQPSQAQNTQFYCGVSTGVPTTIASTPRGNVPVIRWVSNYFSGSGYNPQSRCQEVSSRFQTYYNNGTLSYITTGIMNGLPVICVSSTNGGPCSGLLFTLKKGQNASRTLQQLFDVRTAAAGPLYESSTGGSNKIYIDVENYLNQAAVESNSTPTPEPTNSNPTNNNSGGTLW